MIVDWFPVVFPPSLIMCASLTNERSLPLEKAGHVQVRCIYLSKVKFRQWLNHSQQEPEREWNGLSRV